MNELIAHYMDHDYVRRNGVLYDEWHMFGSTHRMQCNEEDIPTQAYRYAQPLQYPDKRD